MEQVTPTNIRYIKLGAGGRWEAASFNEGHLEWGLPSDPHDLALAGSWDEIKAVYANLYPARGTATSYTNEAKAFYDGDPETLWITFARGRMWWAQAESEVHLRGSDGVAAGTRYRVVRGRWRDHDAEGVVLSLDRLSTRLTRLASYQRTICGLDAEQERLCLRYINAAADEEQRAVRNARDALRERLMVLIQRLSWNDFEQLVDLALARSGWLRVSALGETEKDIDLVVEQPLTGERIAVQVKSSATQEVVNDYAARLALRSADERCMLVCHSPAGTLVAPPAIDGRHLELMLGAEISDLSIRTGLVDWVVNRSL